MQDMRDPMRLLEIVAIVKEYGDAWDRAEVIPILSIHPEVKVSNSSFDELLKSLFYVIAAIKKHINRFHNRSVTINAFC